MNRRTIYTLGFSMLMAALVLVACNPRSNDPDLLVDGVNAVAATQISQSATLRPTNAAGPDLNATNVAIAATNDALRTQLTAIAVPSVVLTATLQPTVAAPPMPDPSCALLDDGNGTIIGSVCFPRDDAAPAYRIPVPEGGYSLVSIGGGKFDNSVVSSDGETLNVLLIPGSLPDGSTPADLNNGVTMSAYVPGSVAVTHITNMVGQTMEDVLKQLLLLDGENRPPAPNCGAEGCNHRMVWMWNWNTGKLDLVKTFTYPKP